MLDKINLLFPVIIICKHGYPFLDVFQLTNLLPIGKLVIKPFGSIIYISNYSFNNSFIMREMFMIF
jgi:hypothetical protein